MRIDLGAHLHMRTTAERGLISLEDAEMTLVGAMMRVRDLTHVAFIRKTHKYFEYI